MHRWVHQGENGVQWTELRTGGGQSCCDKSGKKKKRSSSKSKSQCQEQVITWESLAKEAPEPLKSAFPILLYCLPQLDGKIILLKTPCTLIVEQRNRQHGPGNSHRWLDFIVLKDATQTAGRKDKNGLTQGWTKCAMPRTCKTAHWCNSGVMVVCVTNGLLTGSEAYSLG